MVLNLLGCEKIWDAGEGFEYTHSGSLGCDNKLGDVGHGFQ